MARARKKITPNRVKILFGNITTVEFADAWPNGRPFKHGAMKINFSFLPGSQMAAEDEVEFYMAEKGYERGIDYHIPGWNFNHGHVRNQFYITFDNDETFVMAKLSWGLSDESE